MRLTFIFIILLFITATSGPISDKTSNRRKGGRPDVYIGSKLNTKGYNKELEVIEHGKVDLQTAFGTTGSRKKLLCATFLSGNSSLPSLMFDNVKTMGTHCDWALIFYSGDTPSINKICNDERIKGKWIHCERNVATIRKRFMPNAVNKTANTTSNVKLSVPKTIFYRDLLPYLPKYEKVFLMDEDISLTGFEIERFLSHWQCSFTPPPLIVQPLVFESNQYINYLNLNSWKKGDRKGIFASSVGLIEQQVPFFESTFFEWFVRRVLVHTYDTALYRGVDWGHDRSWCNAAAMYARLVLNRTAESSVVCAVLPRGTPIHHYNHKSMATKRDNRALFHANGVQVVQHYINLFPTWVITDVLAPNNPLDHRNFHKYPRVSQLDQQCVEKYRNSTV